MMELPFEHDTPELLEACSLALTAVEPSPRTPMQAVTAGMTGMPQTQQTDRPAWTMRRESPQHTPALPAEAQRYFLQELPMPVIAPADAEAISRTVERDARRFEK